MKRFIAIFFTASIMSGCGSNVNTVPDFNQMPSQGVNAQNTKNGIFWDSFKIRMGFVETTIDNKDFYLCSPAIVVSNGMKEGLFNNLTLKMPGKEIMGYIVAAKDGTVYVEEYNSVSEKKHTLNDTMELYPVGSWIKKGNFNPKKLEKIDFKKINVMKYEAELHLNPMTHEYLTITSKTSVKPVMKKRSEMLLIAR